MTRRELPGERAWAWKCDFGLCAWALPQKQMLLQESKPSSEAKPVLVRLIREKELAKLYEAASAAGGAQ